MPSGWAGTPGAYRLPCFQACLLPDMNSVPACPTLPTATKDVLTHALANFYSYSGGLNNSPLKCLSPNLWDLWPYMADFPDRIKFSILRWGDDPGLSGWTPNAISGVLIRERRSWHRGEERSCDCGGQIRVRPQAKDAGSYQKLEEVGNRFVPKYPRGSPALPTP